MKNSIVIYHGSKDLITKPKFGYGKAWNDYGLGFYTTESLELAKEWACASGKDGFANKYELNLDGLKVLNLNTPSYHILNWLAILLENRTFNANEGVPLRAKKYIIDAYLPDYKSYDVIVGYRADNSYFSYAGDFIDNTISLESLKVAMSLGKLGEQVVLKSQKAFESLCFIESIPSSSKEYYAKYRNRDVSARNDYKALKNALNPEDGIYVLDIIRGKYKNDDARLR